MTIWAIADLHLALSLPEKDMKLFGAVWEGYTEKIAAHWHRLIQPDDLVLIAGDISWAMRPNDMVEDLAWIDRLPGTKVIIRGNHDYWWSSLAKVKQLLPPSMHALQHTRFDWKGVTISGTRLWDSDEFTFNHLIEWKENPRAQTATQKRDDQKIFERELHRLDLAIRSLNPQADKRIIMTHYPPLGADLAPSRASQLLEAGKIDICVFGHLHSLKPDLELFGHAHGVEYLLTSADYLDFRPIPILD